MEATISSSSAGAALHGIVTADGQPVMGAVITLRRGWTRYVAQTDADGVYTYSSLPAATYDIRGSAAELPGLPPTLSLDIGSVDLESEVRQDVPLETFGLTIRAMLAERPIPNVRIMNCVFALGFTGEDGRTITGQQAVEGYTDAGGRLHARVLPTSGETKCRAGLPGTTSQTFPIPAIGADREVVVEFPLIRYRGVLQANQQPVVGHTMSVAGTLSGESGTGESGQFDLELTPGHYRLSVAGAAPAGADVPAEYALEGTVSGGAARWIFKDLTEKLDLPVHTLSVLVVDQHSRPVRGATVDQVVSEPVFRLGGWDIGGGSFRLKGTAGDDGRMELPAFPTTEGFELEVRGPAGSRFTDATASVGAISADQQLTVVLQSQNEPPVAVAGGPYAAAEGSAVVLDGSGSSDPDGDDLSYEWVLSDGRTASGVTAEFGFTDGPAKHTATLTVTDPAGETSEASATITVRNVAPSLWTEDVEIYSGESFKLAASFDDPGDDRWSYLIDWSAADRSSGALQAVGAFSVTSPRFHAAGEHVVRVEVADDDGGAGTADVVVTVLRQPIRLDVLPEDPDNVLKLNPIGDGVMAVAILSEADLDATRLDLATLRLTDGSGEGAPVSIRNGTDYMVSEVDVDGDGLLDLLVHFDRQQLIGTYITPETTTVFLLGAMPEGVEVAGSDGISPIP